MRRLTKVLIPVLWAFAAVLAHAQAPDAPPKPPSPIALDGVEVELGPWQLPEGHFVTAKMPMVATHPRPAAETSSWERHKWAYPGIQYRIPIAIQGGSYPFYFEIVSGPPGMHIGQQYGASDYSILTWTPSSNGGPHDVHIRVYDQEHGRPNDSFIDVQFQLTVTDSKDRFVFVDPSASSGGDGSIGSPLQLFSDLYANGHNQKVAYLRTGTHYTRTVADTGVDFNIRSTDSPMTFLNYPGDNATLTLERANFRLKNGSVAHGIFIGGLTIKNTYINPDGSTNGRMFEIDGGSFHRFTFFENDFENVYGRGTGDYAHLPSGSTQGITYKRLSTAYDQYCTLWGNTMKNVQVRGFGPFYTVQYGVAENNRHLEPVSTSSGRSGMIVDQKAQGDLWSYRRNVAVADGLNAKILQQSRRNATSTITGPLRLEMSYNVLHVTPSTEQAINFNTSSTSQAVTDETWIYRNTVIGRISQQSDGGGTHIVTLEKNVYLTDGTHYQDQEANMTLVVNDDLTGTGNDVDAMLDSEYRLKGEHREKFLGTHGHEIIQ